MAPNGAFTSDYIQEWLNGRNNEISMRVKTPMCQTRNGYLLSEGKAAFLVQQSRPAIFRR